MKAQSSCVFSSCICGINRYDCKLIAELHIHACSGLHSVHPWTSWPPPPNLHRATRTHRAPRAHRRRQHYVLVTPRGCGTPPLVGCRCTCRPSRAYRKTHGDVVLKLGRPQLQASSGAAVHKAYIYTGHWEQTTKFKSCLRIWLRGMYGP